MNNKTDIEEDIKIVNEILLHNRETKEVRQAIENILADRERLEKENKNIKKILKRDIRECKSEIVTVQGNKQRKELSGAIRRHIASLSGRQNEAIRVLNILEGGNSDEDRRSRSNY